MRAEALFLASALTMACASRETSIDTIPNGADIFIVSSDGKKTAVGTSPLRKPSEDIASKAPAGAPLLLRLEKEGYFPAYVLLDPQRAGSPAVVFTLEPRGPVVTPLLRDAIALSFEAERMLMEKRYVDAKAQAKKIQEKYPALTMGWIIEATALELEGRQNESLPLWRRAVEADPEDPYLQRMLKGTDP